MAVRKSDTKNKNRLLQGITEGNYGKMVPYALEEEMAVLGAMMLDKEALADVIDILSAEMFYDEKNARIFDAIHQIFHRSMPVDMLTVTQELKKLGTLDLAGGSYYVASLTNRISSAAHAEAHARIVIQKHLQRELIRTAEEIRSQAYENHVDVFELLDEATQSIFSIHDRNVRRQHEKMSTLVALALQEMDAAANHKEGLTGVPSGFVQLDRITGGWQKSDLIIIAARPGMGKTAFVLTLARNAAISHRRPVAIFSLEMSNMQLVKRLISSETEIHQDKILKGNLEDYEYVQLQERIKSLDEAPIYIDDTPALTLFELRAKARRLKEKHQVELLVVDYLQLMQASTDPHQNRVQEISEISRGLKSLAKELNIPVIALSQLSRQVENRQSNSKRPQLSDLRESGSIEQDADQVFFIYRPEYYGIDVDENGQSTRGIAEIIIGKNRHGALGTIRLRFVGHLAKFKNLDESETWMPGEATSDSLKENQSFLSSSFKTIPSGKWEQLTDDEPGILGSNESSVEEDF